MEDILKFKPKKNNRTIVHFKNTTMKVLNLYSCLGGNRKLWKDCDVTAVELDPELSRMYKHLYPGDKVIVQDAHDFLINNFKDLISFGVHRRVHHIQKFGFVVIQKTIQFIRT